MKKYFTKFMQKKPSIMPSTGLNDLAFTRSGDLYFTDQGQTGLHDPTGQVFRLRPDGRLDLGIANGPSPNGLVLSPDDAVLTYRWARCSS